MKIRFNPITKKELKLGARTFKFPLGISIYAFAFAFLSLFMFLINTQWLSVVMGQNVYLQTVNYNSITEGFQVLAVFQVFMICIIVPILTASSIAGERERQTLDIMLTAPVSSFSIATGKLMASLANVFLFVISTLPAMAICFLYGGIEWKYLLVFVVDIMVLAFFVGAIGVWTSAIFKRTIVSVIMSFLYELLFFLIPIILYAVIYLVKFNKLAATLPAGQQYSTAVDMGWNGIILIFSPILTILNSVLTATSSTEVIKTMTTNMFGLSTAPQSFVSFISVWSYVGIVIMILIGFFFLFLTARKIDAPGRIHGKRK